jgi:hypothetical protein
MSAKAAEDMIHTGAQAAPKSLDNPRLCCRRLKDVRDMSVTVAYRRQAKTLHSRRMIVVATGLQQATIR